MAGRGSRKIPNENEVRAQFIQAIKNHRGLLTVACQKVNICYHTYRRWYKENEEFQKEVDKALEQAHEKTTDYAEDKLFEAMERNELTATIFYLKTKGKKRGYVERQEITGKDGESLFEKETLSKIAKELLDEK